MILNISYLLNKLIGILGETTIRACYLKKYLKINFKFPGYNYLTTNDRA